MSYQRDFERRLRVGVVGVGHHAYRNILPALHFLPVTLAALCDIDGELLRRTASEYHVPGYRDAEEMFTTAGLDAVLLCVGARHHARLATQALRASLHVWMEKPPALRATEVEALAAEAGDLTCAVGYKKAYLPAVRKARELMSAPDFGGLRSLLAIYPMTIPRDGAAVLASGASTNWLSNGCHPLSVMLALGGEVTAVRTVRGPGEKAHGAVHLDYANDAIGTLYLAGDVPMGTGVERYELLGDRRTIRIEDSAKISYDRGGPFDYNRQRDFTSPGVDTGSVVWTVENRLATLENMSFFLQGFVDELLDFCRCALGEPGPPLCDLSFALRLMRVYEAALLSSGEPVSVLPAAPGSLAAPAQS
jgi:predicted dehydrogenase